MNETFASAPLVSVIVPIYKVENYINRCVESIRNQTYRNIEIILVDDGSPDNCPTICDEYAGKDERIKAIHKENGGLSSARNAGIDVSRGDYIVFVDGDDYIHPMMIETMLKEALKSEADLCICGTSWVNEDETAFDDAPSSPIKNEVLEGNPKLQLLTRDGYLYYITACNKLYKKYLFESIRFPEGKLHEDEFTAHLFLDASNRVVCIEDKLYFYVQHKNSIMHSTFNIKRAEGVDAILDRAALYKRKGLNDDYKYTVNAAAGFLIRCVRSANVRENRAVLGAYRKKIAKLLGPSLMKAKMNLFYCAMLWFPTLANVHLHRRRRG